MAMGPEHSWPSEYVGQSDLLHEKGSSLGLRCVCQIRGNALCPSHSILTNPQFERRRTFKDTLLCRVKSLNRSELVDQQTWTRSLHARRPRP